MLTLRFEAYKNDNSRCFKNWANRWAAVTVVGFTGFEVWVAQDLGIGTTAAAGGR